MVLQRYMPNRCCPRSNAIANAAILMVHVVATGSTESTRAQRRDGMLCQVPARKHHGPGTYMEVVYIRQN